MRRGRVLFPDRVAIALAAFTCVIAPLTLVTLQIDSNIAGASFATTLIVMLT